MAATELCTARGPACLLLHGGHDCRQDIKLIHIVHICHCGAKWTAEMPEMLPSREADLWYVGRQMRLGTESAQRDRHLQKVDSDGSRYFPLHEGTEGKRAGFPVDAEHVGTCQAVDDTSEGALVRMTCTCGARWAFYPGGGILA
jgi:hypothetical protein